MPSSTGVLRVLNKNSGAIVSTALSYCFQLLSSRSSSAMTYHEEKEGLSEQNARFIYSVLSDYDANHYPHHRDMAVNQEAYAVAAEKTVTADIHNVWIEAFNKTVPIWMRLPENMRGNLVEYYRKTCLTFDGDSKAAAVLSAYTWYRLPAEHPTVVKAFSDLYKDGMPFPYALALSNQITAVEADRALFKARSVYETLFEGHRFAPRRYLEASNKRQNKLDILQPMLFAHLIKTGFNESSCETIWKITRETEGGHLPNPGLWDSYKDSLRSMSTSKHRKRISSAYVDPKVLREGGLRTLARAPMDKAYRVLERIAKRKSGHLENPFMLPDVVSESDVVSE